MPEAKISRLQFMDGVGVDGSVDLFVAGSLQSGNFNLTRLCWRLPGGEWQYKDVPTIVVSVWASLTQDGYPRTYFALGRDGIVVVGGSGRAYVEESIPDAGTGKGKYGYLSQVREIDGRIYVCGDQGQVYCREKGRWVHIDQGLLHPEHRERDLGLNGIDGASAKDLFVVGDYGAIFHFDGKKWKDESYPTNLTLERVRCIAGDATYVCGDAGLLLRGDGKSWEEIGDPGVNGNIWDLEWMNGRLYLAVEDQLMVQEEGKIVPVDTKLSPPVDAHRLHSRNGRLWSIGENHIACFDGSAWDRVLHPDNK